MFAEGRMDDGVLRLEQAMREDPGDHEVRAQYFRQRDIATGQLLLSAESERMARRTDAAESLYRRVQRMDAGNIRAREGLSEISLQRRHESLLREAEALFGKGDGESSERIVRAVLNERPANLEARQLLERMREQASGVEAAPLKLQTALNKPITLEFREAPLKTVFEVIARTSGVNFVFDKDVRSDTKVTIFVRNAGMDEVMKLILATNQLERKLINENSVLIYPNTPAKAKDYLELVTRSFYLANADVKQAQALVRALVKTKDTFADEKLNLLVIKDTAEAVRLAEKLLESLDMAEPEVMLEVEVLEITRSKLQELGLRFPDQIGYGLLQPSTSSTIVNSGVTQTTTNLGGSLAAGYVDLQNRGALTSFVSNPALMLNLRSEAGDGNLLANPRIRVRNREKAKIHIGDKLPVFTTTSTANVGVSASVAYLDVGLKLDVEPSISLDDEVSIRVGLEVSSVVREVPGPASSLAYQIGTRSAATVLRLRNGETQVLAGLISDEERSSANRLPGLGEIPLVGRLFGSQRDSNSKTEIVLLITPRIVRNVVRPQAAANTVSAGTESSVGAPLLQLKRGEPRSLSMSSTPSTAPRITSATPLPETPNDPASGAPLSSETPSEPRATGPASKESGPPPVPAVPAALKTEGVGQ